MAALETFLPYVDNWATCDLLSPKAFRKHPPELRKQIRRWVEDAHTYTVRFGLGMLMSFYLDEGFQMEDLDLAAGVRREEYYVKMMAAWYFATALAKQYDAALPYLRQRRLDRWTHNKTIQKAVESYRITPEQKDELRSLRWKDCAKGGGGMKGRSCGLFLCLFLGIACFSGYQVLRILPRVPGGSRRLFQTGAVCVPAPCVGGDGGDAGRAGLAGGGLHGPGGGESGCDCLALRPDTGISYPVVQGTDQ